MLREQLRDEVRRFRAVQDWKLGMVRSALICRRFYEHISEVVTTDEYEVRFLTSYMDSATSCSFTETMRCTE